MFCYKLCFQVEERYFLEHSFEHMRPDATCKFCFEECRQGLETTARRKKENDRSVEKFRIAEIDVYLEALDSAIDYKQVNNYF
jgi:hypothetical protein